MTRAAILWPLAPCWNKKSYSHITVQEILDVADIGRSTFYAHFETKDALLKAVCQELFQHIVDSAMDATHTHGLYSAEKAPKSMFCHLLQHLERNNRMVGLLCGENGDLFQRYFKGEPERTGQNPGASGGRQRDPRTADGFSGQSHLGQFCGDGPLVAERQPTIHAGGTGPVFLRGDPACFGGTKRTGGETTARQQNCQ